MYDIERMLLPALMRPLTPAERRKLADTLEQIATLQRTLADADQRVGHIVRRSAIESAPRTTGRPRGSGARFIRIVTRRNGIGAVVHVGRAIWQELGEPKRLDIQRHGFGGQLWMRPCAEGIGYRVTQPPNGMPRFTVGQDAVDALGLTEGRHDGAIISGAIVIGAGS